MFYLIN